MKDQLLIGGSWVDGTGGERIEVANPANGEVIASVADGTPADANAAVEAASIAQAEWAKVAPRARAEVLRSCWQILLDHADELAELITLEHGKPLADAKGEVAYSAEFFRWNSEETVRIHGSMSLAPSGNNKIIVRHPPVGVVTMVTPWNFPAAMITRKLAPALAAGNAVVIKPAAETPLTALRVAQLLHDAGVPAGVVNSAACAGPKTMNLFVPANWLRPRIVPKPVPESLRESSARFAASTFSTMPPSPAASKKSPLTISVSRQSADARRASVPITSSASTPGTTSSGSPSARTMS